MQTWSHLKYLLRCVPQLISLRWRSYLSSVWPNSPDWQARGGASTAHLPTPPRCISSPAEAERFTRWVKKTFLLPSLSHEPDHHKWVHESVTLLSAQILPRSDWINPHSFILSLTAALSLNSKTLKEKKNPQMRDQNHPNSHCAFRCRANPTCLMIFKLLFLFLFPISLPDLSLSLSDCSAPHLYSLISPNYILETTSISLSFSLSLCLHQDVKWIQQHQIMEVKASPLLSEWYLLIWTRSQRDCPPVGGGAWVS